jgi:hypothetical protein
MKAIVALLSSIFLSPLGLEGLILQTCGDKTSAAMRKRALFTSIGKWIAIIAFIGLSIKSAQNVGSVGGDEEEGSSGVTEGLLVASILILILLCLWSIGHTAASLTYC